MSDKEHDFGFCRPQIACRGYLWIKTSFTWVEIPTAAASKIFFGLVCFLILGKTSFFFCNMLLAMQLGKRARLKHARFFFFGGGGGGAR